MVDTFGKHLLAEYHGCSAAILNDQERLRALMRRGAEAAGANVVAEVYQPFAPQGISGVSVIEESHLSIHTWPERGYAAVDFYTCGDCVAERAHTVLFEGLEAQRSELMVVHRGRHGSAGSMHIEAHRHENRASEPLPLVGEGG
jgi:S-adenosylmethionine decarboxylase